jgi:hypothetical protein
MTDVFDVLAADHEEVKRLFAELQTGQVSGPGATEEQLRNRKKTAESLVIEESRHEALEEMYFWPAIREYVPGGTALADEATGQEQEAKLLLDKLDKTGPAQPEFEALLTAVIRAGWDHIHFEETRVWPRARTALSVQVAADLGTRITEGRDAAPTRPHPYTAPEVLKAAGPAVAAADKIRDAFTGRGE